MESIHKAVSLHTDDYVRAYKGFVQMTVNGASCLFMERHFKPKIDRQTGYSNLGVSQVFLFF